MSKIEWTEKTWNPIIGCSKVSEGCVNCYAEKMACRLAGIERSRLNDAFDGEPSLSDATSVGGYDSVTDLSTRKWNGKTHFVESALKKPLHWRKPSMIFVGSMTDLFHESVPFEWVDKIMAVMMTCSQHKFQILTKRSKRMLEYCKRGFKADANITSEMWVKFGSILTEHLWLGVSVENQERADERIPDLLQTPAAVRFVSIEPCLGDVDLSQWIYENACGCLDRFDINHCVHCNDTGAVAELDWVIVGCESGPNRRPCKVEWVESVVEQCQAANIPVFVKQLDIGGKVVKDIEQFPKHLQIRQWPERKER